MRDSTGNFDHVDLTAIFRMKFESDAVSVWRPTGAASCAMKRCDLVAAGSLDITRPDVPEAQAIGFKGNLLSFRRQLGAHLVPFFRYQGCGGFFGVLGILQPESPDVECGKPF